MKSTKSDRELVLKLDGLFVGQLTLDEMESFNRCIDDKVARRVYDSPTSFMLGLSKVKYESK